MTTKLFKRSSHERLKDPHYGFLLQPPQSNEWVALETEFVPQPNNERLIKVGALIIRGNQAQTNQHLELSFHTRGEVVQQEGIEIPILRPDQAIRRILNFIANRSLVGYQIDHHIEVLNRFVQPILGIPLPNRAIDLVRLYRRKRPLLSRPLARISFDALRVKLGMPRLGHHDAFNDALMSALMFIKLNGVRTLRS